MRTTEKTAITSCMITYDEIRENSKTTRERLYWFTEGIFTRSNTTQNNMYQKYMVGEGKRVCAPTKQTSINFSRLSGAF